MAVPTPAVAATTVPVANNTGQFVDVAITGGTVTSVNVVNNVGATAQVATSSPANVAVPPGGTIAITYSVAPTWAWTDPLNEFFTGYSSENLALINELGQLPFAAHTADGEPGLGEAVSN